MSREPQLLLQDIIESGEAIQSYIAGLDFEQFCADQLRIDAVARKLEASVVVRPDLIGGIRVVVGDEVLDTSVKARLEQMKAALTA